MRSATAVHVGVLSLVDFEEPGAVSGSMSALRGSLAGNAASEFEPSSPGACDGISSRVPSTLALRILKFRSPISEVFEADMQVPCWTLQGRMFLH